MSVLFRTPAIFQDSTQPARRRKYPARGREPGPLRLAEPGAFDCRCPRAKSPKTAPGCGTRWMWKPTQVASAHQVHGKEVLVVSQPGHREGFDALITDRPGIVLAVTIADCTPVLLYDPARRAVAAIHAGWRGTVAGVVPAVLQKMQEHFGTSPSIVWLTSVPASTPILSKSARKWRSISAEPANASTSNRASTSSTCKAQLPISYWRPGYPGKQGRDLALFDGFAPDRLLLAPGRSGYHRTDAGRHRHR